LRFPSRPVDRPHVPGGGLREGAGLGVPSAVMKASLHPRVCLVAGTLAALAAAAVAAPQQPPDPNEFLKRSREFSAGMEKKGLAEPFKGVTTNGTVVPNLFEIKSTGVSTEPVRTAVAAFLKTLSPEQRKKTMFPVDSLEWRK